MRRLYFFYGAEKFLIREAVGALRKQLSVNGDIKIDNYDPDSMSADELVPVLCTPSLFGGDKLAVLDGYDDDDLEKIIEGYGAVPASTTIVITAGKLDKRTSFSKKLASMAEVREFKPFAEWEEDLLLQWITARALSRSVNMDRKTAFLLNSISGPSLAQLSCEIDKLATYIGDRKVATESDVNALAVSGELGAFALENALAERDLKGALKALAGAIKAKEAPQMLIGRIYGRMRTYLRVKSLTEKRLPRQQLLESSGMNPYFFERCMKSSSLYSLDELIRSVRLLSDADIAIKNTMQVPHRVLEIMLVEILSRNEKEKTGAKRD